MKKIGFLSFGHWTPSAQSATRSAADTLLQSIDLAVAAEELGADGAYFRVHHFARQLSSPFPLLAAIGAKTKRIEIGTGVIDMRYENPMYMAEEASAADLISGGRLQLGISRGSPEQVIDGWRYFGYVPQEGENESDMARRHTKVLLEALRGEGFAKPNPQPMFPIHIQQAKQIRAYREAWAQAGHTRTPRVSVSRSIFALMNDRDRSYFGASRNDSDSVGFLDEKTRAIFGRSYAAEPDKLIEQLKQDEAIAEADTLLLTVPNQLGVDYNAHVIESILKHVAPALGWRDS